MVRKQKRMIKIKRRNNGEWEPREKERKKISKEKEGKIQGLERKNQNKRRENKRKERDRRNLNSPHYNVPNDKKRKKKVRIPYSTRKTFGYIFHDPTDFRIDQIHLGTRE